MGLHKIDCSYQFGNIYSAELNAPCYNPFALPKTTLVIWIIITNAFIIADDAHFVNKLQMFLKSHGKYYWRYCS